MILFGGLSVSSVLGDKNLKMDHLGLYRRYMTYPTPCRNVLTECDKKQRGHANELLGHPVVQCKFNLFRVIG